MVKLILASNSKWRKQILDMAGLKYTAVSSDVDENIVYTNPSDYVQSLSKLKGEVVAKKFKEGIVISADTIGYIDNEKFEKPKSKEELFQNMKRLSGRANYIITGVTIIDLYQNKTVTFSDVSEIWLQELSDEEINWYIEHEKDALDSSGFATDRCGSLFAEKIVGDDKSVIGLPIHRIYAELKKLGYKITDLECI